MRLTFDADQYVPMALFGHLPMVAVELGGLRLASTIGILEIHPIGANVSWTYTPLTSAEVAESGTGSMREVRTRIAQLATRIMEVPGARMQSYRLDGNHVEELTDGAYDRGLGYGDLTAGRVGARRAIQVDYQNDDAWAFGNGRPATASNSRIGGSSRSRSPSPRRVSF